MVKYLLHCSSAGKQQNIKLKNFKKKLLTDNNGNVIINELSLRQQKRILKKLLTDKENYGRLFWLSKNDRNS
jgi:hypothetical protein